MISVIIPFHNEAENLEPLHSELTKEFETINKPYEIIFIDDGSTDASAEAVTQLVKKDKNIHLITLRRRFGKGAALAKGVDHSKGDILIFMDGDLQDNPSNISGFLAKLDEGYDLVNGVRRSRKHNPVIRTYSKLGNNFLRSFTHSPFSDINCGFKAFRKEVLDDIVIYANNFRFLPLAAYYQGYKVAEIPVDNRPRLHGVSKFGMGKAFVGFIDTLTVYFLYQFSERPLHFFGIIGSVFLAFGGIITIELIIERTFFGVMLYRRPLFNLGMFLVIVGIQIIMTGFIGELIVYLRKKADKQNGH